MLFQVLDLRLHLNKYYSYVYHIITSQLNNITRAWLKKGITDITILLRKLSLRFNKMWCNYSLMNSHETLHTLSNKPVEFVYNTTTQINKDFTGETNQYTVLLRGSVIVIWVSTMKMPREVSIKLLMLI